MPLTTYRVLIVDDSRLMRQVLTDMVAADGSFTVEATASNGEEAVRLALELRPDIITMDLEMPQMNGLEALRRIMAVRPTPVIMLSAVTDNGARDTIKALQYGAFDFVRKPDRAVQLDIGEVSKFLLEKLHVAAESISRGTLRMLPAVEEEAGPRPPQIADPGPPSQEGRETPPLVSPAAAGPKPAVPQATSELRLEKLADSAKPFRQAKPPARPPKKEKLAIFERKNRLAEPNPQTQVPDAVSPPDRTRKPPVQKWVNPRAPVPPAEKAEARRTSSFSEIVAIGTSTGGPRALHEVLTKLPADLEAPVLIVQHMPPKFTHSLAQRLDSFCAIRVCEASQDELVETATAYIAPGGKHMTIVRDGAGAYRIKLTDDGPRSGHMPSVDVLFESLIGLRGLRRHAVLMTGMGSDGAKGMKALQEDGVATRIAESEETCVVYGMPRSAVELGAASHVLPLQQIASLVVSEVRSRIK